MTLVHSRCHGLVYIGSLLARDVARTHCRRSSSWSSTFSFIIVHADRRRCRPGLSWPLSSALSALPASPARDIHRDIHRAYRSNVNIIWPLIDRFRICMYISAIVTGRFLALISLIGVAIDGEFAIKYHIDLRFDYRTPGSDVSTRTRFGAMAPFVCRVRMVARGTFNLPRTIVACNCFDWFGNLCL